MHRKPDPCDFGSVANYCRSLFEALLQNGYTVPDVLRMSLREALLTMYGSPDAVDGELGDGTYRGVQETYGDLVPWRMAWSRVRRKQKRLYIRQIGALAVLVHDIESCLELGVPELEIRMVFQNALNTPVGTLLHG